MTVEEIKAELEKLIEQIDEANTEEEVEELSERAKTLKEELRNKEAKAESRVSSFNPHEARKQVKGVATMDNIEARENYRQYMMTRADQTTVVADVAVPTVITTAITKENPDLGKILAKTSQTAYPAGVEVPVFNITGSKAVWASENGKFEHKKAGETKVAFTAHKLGNIYGMTKEAQAMSLPEFEANVAKKVVADTIEAKEEGIFVGTGLGQMKGITKENGLVKKDFEATYKAVLDIVATLPTAYAGNAEWFMSQATFYELMGMVDTTGQPIARVNAGFGAIQPILCGKPVNFTKYLPDNATATAGDAVVLYGDMSKYAVNTVWENKLSTHDDFDTDEHLVKSVSIVDGKLLLADAFVAGVKKATASE